eukprot:s1093_g3.t17
MCRKHHPHPLEYTAAAYPVQKATLPLGRFKSIGWSIPAASWCREEKEQSRWTAFLLVRLLICSFAVCSWKVQSNRFCTGPNTQHLATFPQWILTRVAFGSNEFCHSWGRKAAKATSGFQPCSGNILLSDPAGDCHDGCAPAVSLPSTRGTACSPSDVRRRLRGREAGCGKLQPFTFRFDPGGCCWTPTAGPGFVPGRGIGTSSQRCGALHRDGDLHLHEPSLLHHRRQAGRPRHKQCLVKQTCAHESNKRSARGHDMQCSQPIFTLSISLALGWEGASLLKTLGIAISFLGGAFMICYGQPVHSPGFAGNILLLLNCLGTSLYVILGKFAMDRYPSLSITAWSYINASVMMAIAAVSLNTQCWFIEFVCPPNEGSTAQCGTKPTSCTAWSVPPEVRGMARMQQFCHPSQQSQVLEHKFTRESHWVSIGGYGINGAYAAHVVMSQVYWILFNSMAAYFLITWANQYARAGFVLAYTALQPFTSTVLTAALVVTGRFPSLSLPGWNALGGLGVVAGMLKEYRGNLCASFGTARNNTSTTLHGRSARFHSTRRIRSCQMSVSLPEGGGDGGWLRLLRSTGDETSTQCSIWRCYNNQSMESLRLMQLLILRRRHSVGQDRRCMARIVQMLGP